MFNRRGQLVIKLLKPLAMRYHKIYKEYSKVQTARSTKVDIKGHQCQTA